MSKPARKQYNFSSVSGIRRDAVAEYGAVQKSKPTLSTLREGKRKKAPLRQRDLSSDDDDNDANASSPDENEDDKNERSRSASDSDAESAESEADQQQLEGEEGVKLNLKRLPELVFGLNFAHKRARELLLAADEDDTALISVVCTWLGEVGDRFETFEKQAQKFDNFENALLQSQRMHSKLRGQIAASLKLEREHKRILHESTVASDRRKKTAQETKKSAQLMKLLSEEAV